MVFFRRIFRFSSQSHSLYPRLQTKGNDHLFCSMSGPFVRQFARSWLTQKVRAILWSERLCTDWRFSVTETLAVILNCRWQVTGLKVLSTAFGKRTSSFPQKKTNKQTIKKITIKIGKQNSKSIILNLRRILTNEWEHLKRKDSLEDFPHPS